MQAYAPLLWIVEDTKVAIGGCEQTAELLAAATSPASTIYACTGPCICLTFLHQTSACALDAVCLAWQLSADCVLASVHHQYP